MADVIYSLLQQIQQAKDNLLLLDERMSEYVQTTDIPLQYVKEKRQLGARLAELEGRLERLRNVSCPYRGLEPFDVEHAEFYFGQEAAIQKLVAGVEKNSFVAVVGPSGSGKSSLVRAGLVAELHKGALRDSHTWDIEILKPGADPLRAFAMALVVRLQPAMSTVEQMTEARKLADSLLRGDLTVPRDVIPILHHKNAQFPHFMLVIDQFEEIFDPRVGEDLRRTFLDALLTADDTGWLKIVLTVRADFYGRLFDDRRLGERVDAGLINVMPMDKDQRHEAIEKPALVTGRRFEEGLVSRIQDALEAGSGNLPLLEFTLTELWKRQTADGLLTHAAYQEIGEISGAIANHAAEIFDDLTDDQREQTRRLFLRLVRLPSEDPDIERAARRRISLEDLDQTTQALVRDKLADARLVVTGHDSANDVETVELVHEALITSWQQLRDWLSENPAALRLHQSLTEATEIWKRHGQDRDLLWRGHRLDEVQAWASRHEGELNKVEQEFLDASRTQERTRRVRLIGAVALVVVLMASLAGGMFVWNQGRTPAVEIPMPADGFNIAVASLLAAELPQDPALQDDVQRDGEALGQKIAQLLKDQQKELSEEMEGLSINILAPSQWPEQYRLKAITDENLAQAARELRADIIVYGTLRPVSSRVWQVEPRFYIADRITKGRADEMGGAEGLGKPISYQPGNRSTISETMAVLQPRIHLLARLISGLHYQGRGNEKGFEQSAQIFCGVGDEFPVARVGVIGQELLYTFCGQSKAQLAWFVEDTSRRHEILSQALLAFDKGLEITPQHLRAQVSRAATLVQLGMPGFDCEDGDLDKLRQAQGILENRGSYINELVSLPEGLQNGIHLNLGHIYFWLGFCDANLGGQNPLWPIARSHYEAVIELQHQSNAPDSISAATSYAYIGYTFMLSDTPDYELAFGQFDRSVTMLQRDGDDQAMKYAIELMPLVLSLQCKTSQRTSARQRLDAFVNALPNPQSTRDEILSHISPKTKEACQL